ncbi:hypothetical protein [Streptomyces sp. NPDC019890]|uniref:hypothetical protein n=1 Tax=Streptomyces sp. NPDC019890 TaxID=3365064 RepID=UPI00384DF3C8
MPANRGGQIGGTGLVGVEICDGVDTLTGLTPAGLLAAAVDADGQAGSPPANGGWGETPRPDAELTTMVAPALAARGLPTVLVATEWQGAGVFSLISPGQGGLDALRWGLKKSNTPIDPVS